MINYTLIWKLIHHNIIYMWCCKSLMWKFTKLIKIIWLDMSFVFLRRIWFLLTIFYILKSYNSIRYERIFVIIFLSKYVYWVLLNSFSFEQRRLTLINFYTKGAYSMSLRRRATVKWVEWSSNTCFWLALDEKRSVKQCKRRKTSRIWKSYWEQQTSRRRRYAWYSQSNC